MATVYSAEDLRHQRLVAIKVLHPELGAVLGLERFLSEIRVTASLQHPNILPLFDSGAADGLVFYVMPLVEGETLRARIDREQQLPIADIVRIVQSIGGALDYAHRHGVIHRDIKPENIMLVDGHALVADFGIARAVTSAAGERMTESGISVGTPQYMSPEQASAERQLDGRTDVYSLGAVAYEMLTGEPPFSGPNAPAIIAKLMTEAVADVSLRRKSVPRELAAAVHTALQRVPADRFETAAEFAGALNRPQPRSESTKDAATAMRPGVISSRRRIGPFTSRLVLGGLALVVASAAITATILYTNSNKASRAEAGPIYASIPIQQSPVSTNGGYANIAISPDGRTLVFRQADGLHVRPLGDRAATLLPGTEGAAMPAFAPDGKTLVFVQSGAIRKLGVAGGPVTDVAAFAASGGLDWAVDGNVYSSAGVSSGEIWRTPAAGGMSRRVTQIDTTLGEVGHVWPQLLPGGKAILFTAMGPSGGSEDSRVVVERLDSHVRQTLMQKAMFGRYLTTGQLTYAKNDGTIFAVDFDLKSLRVTGKPEPVMSGVETALWGGSAFLAVSSNGTAVFLPRSAVLYNAMQIVDRSGRPISSLIPPRDELAGVATLSLWGDARISPDGQRVASTGRQRGVADIWILDAKSRNADRFSFDPVEEEYPVWSSDGRTIAYTVANAGSSRRVVSKSTGSAATPRVLRTWPRHLHLTSWSPDKRYLAFYDYTANNGSDAWVIDVEGKDSILISGGPRSENSPAFSPDGHWIAYQSDETGRSEIYVVPFPMTGAKWQASADGAALPRWDPSGRALYYMHNGYVMAQPVDTRREFSKGAASPLFATDAYSFDVVPDGQHFLLVRPHSDNAGTLLMLVTNWFETVRDRMKATPSR
jgi:serine/threonine-protein kinase